MEGRCHKRYLGIAGPFILRPLQKMYISKQAFQPQQKPCNCAGRFSIKCIVMCTKALFFVLTP